MTKFNKASFDYHGGYLTYTVAPGTTPKFVARFKYRGAPFSKGKFLAQLIKNHTVEEYFKKLEIDHVAPLTILAQADPKWYEAQLAAFRNKNANR